MRLEYLEDVCAVEVLGLGLVFAWLHCRSHTWPRLALVLLALLVLYSCEAYCEAELVIFHKPDVPAWQEQLWSCTRRAKAQPPSSTHFDSSNNSVLAVITTAL